MSDINVPPTRMDKKQLYKVLISKGYTKEQLSDENGKLFKRPELLKQLKLCLENEKIISILGNVEEIDDEDDLGVEINMPEKISSQQETVEIETAGDDLPKSPPDPCDPEWTQYVLGQFMDDEVDGQNPRVEGLRRIAGLILGEMIEEGCDLVCSPTSENGFRAAVKAWGIFMNRNTGITKRFEALADAHPENCIEDYATYLVAMADTRAKGRMFRNALCLKRVVSAEEISKTVANSSDVQSGGSIHTSQITMIRMMATRNNFIISDVLDDLGIEYKMDENTGDVNLQSLTYEDALLTAKRMRELKEESTTPKTEKGT